jgi:hypothetical protein
MNATIKNEMMPREDAEKARSCGFIDCMGIFVDDYVIGFGIPTNCIEAATMRALANKAAEWATAALRCARLRGDNGDDPVGTREDALMAAEFISGFAVGLRGAANKLDLYENSFPN